jgi:hypothetical protein
LVVFCRLNFGCTVDFCPLWAACLQFRLVQDRVDFHLDGVLAAINQTVLLRRVWLKYFSEAQLEIIMTVMLGMSYLLFGSDVLPLFFLALPLFATAQSVQRVVITSEVAGRVDPLMKGEALGILTSLMAASMVVGPIVGGALFEIHDGYPYFFGGFLMLISLFVTLRFQKSASTHSAPAPVSTENTDRPVK